MPSKLLARPAEQRDKAFEMFCAGGRTHEQIGKALGIPPTTISSWSYRFKWGARKQALALVTEPSKSGRKAAAAVSEVDSSLTYQDIQSEYRAIAARTALRIARTIERTPDAMLIAGSEKILKADQMARKALDLEHPTPSVVVNIGLLSQSQPPQATLPSAPALPVIAAPVLAVEVPSQEQPTIANDTGVAPALAHS